MPARAQGFYFISELHLSVIPFTGGVFVQERGVPVLGGLCSRRGGLCMGVYFQGGCLCLEGGSLSMGVSVQGGCLCLGRGLCPGEVSVQLRGTLSREGDLCPGDSLSGRPPYGNVRAVRILLECILV